MSWSRFFPGLRWLRAYRGAWLRGDLAAGLILAAYLLPAALADASLANLSPSAGLYACLFSGLVFWLFCSSRSTAITVTSAISLLVGASLSDMTQGDPARFGALAASTALIVGAMAFVAWLLRAGAIVKFISETVLHGFKLGVALLLVSTQLPKLLGMQGSHGGFPERAGHFLTHLREVQPASAWLGIAALAVLMLGKRFFRDRPVALFVVIAGILTARSLGLAGIGVKVLGSVPRGLPAPGWPAVTLSDLKALMPLSMACFLLGMVETAAIGRMFAIKHHYRFDANQELLGVAGANVIAGFARSLPVSGGMSQSLVNEGGGARTPLSGLVASGLLVMVVLFFSGALSFLPQTVLAAIVLATVSSLFQGKALRSLWRSDRSEFLAAMASLLGVLCFGLLMGVLIGTAISLTQLLGRASRPHVAFLGRVPGTRRFSDMERHPENESVPGVLLFRVEAALLYFNAEHVRDAVMRRVVEARRELRLVVCDLSTSPHVDLGATQMLEELYEQLSSMGIGLRVVEARSSVRDRLRRARLEEKVGGVDRLRSPSDVVEEFLGSGAGAGWELSAEGPLNPNRAAVPEFAMEDRVDAEVDLNRGAAAGERVDRDGPGGSIGVAVELVGGGRDEHGNPGDLARRHDRHR